MPFVLLFVSLVSVSHWGLLGLSSAGRTVAGQQRCCDEMDMLRKEFSDAQHEYFMEDCTSWLAEVRASRRRTNHMACSLSEHELCEKVDCLRTEDEETHEVNTSGIDRDGSLAVRNILRVIDTQTWHTYLIFCDHEDWFVLHLLTSALSDRGIKFIIYDAVVVNQTSELREVVGLMFGQLHVRNVIVMSDPALTNKLFKEAEQYDRSLGRTSGLRMLIHWIVYSPSGLEVQIASAAAYFDNVVAIIQKDVFLKNSSEFDICVMTETSTLMYVGNSRREFQSVTVLLPDVDDLVIKDAFPNKQHFFNARTLTVGTKDWDPFIIKSRDKHSGKIIYTGLCIDLLNELAYRLNFTYEIVEPPWSEGWGSRNASGQWEGLVGQLQRQEVDVVVAPLSFSADRALVMDATYPYVSNYLCALFKNPDPALTKWRTYLRPFQGEVLICLAITLLVVTFLLHLISWYNRNNETSYSHCDKGKNNGSLQLQKNAKPKQVHFPGSSPDDGFWYLYGALLAQGGVLLPTSSSGRMLVAAWWLFSIVIASTYSGNLIAFLTVHLEVESFSDMQDILKHGTYSWGVMGKTVDHNILMESRNPVLQEIRQDILEHVAHHPETLSLDMDLHLTKVNVGGYALFSDIFTTEALTRANCDLGQITKISKRDTEPTHFTINLPKGSAYTSLFNDYVMKIVEAGLMYKWKRDWLADHRDYCATNIVGNAPKITVLDVQSVLYLGAIGVVLALVVLALEFFFHCHPTLKVWTNRMTNVCVDGCNEEAADEKEVQSGSELRENRDSRYDHQRPRLREKLSFTNDNKNSTNEGWADEGSKEGIGSGEVTGGVGLHEVILTVDLNRNEGERDIFDLGSFGSGEVFEFRSGLNLRQNRNFLYENVYYKPEDFGRCENDLVH